MVLICFQMVVVCLLFLFICRFHLCFDVISVFDVQIGVIYLIASRNPPGQCRKRMGPEGEENACPNISNSQNGADPSLVLGGWALER